MGIFQRPWALGDSKSPKGIRRSFLALLIGKRLPSTEAEVFLGFYSRKLRIRRRRCGDGLVVGIQHPGLPVDMLMSCPSDDVLELHVLDVNVCCLQSFSNHYSFTFGCWSALHTPMDTQKAFKIASGGEIIPHHLTKSAYSLSF